MRRTTGMITTGLLVAAAALSGGAALAAPGRAGAQQSEHERIVQYWTAERRASAIPRDVVLPAPRGAKATPHKGKPGGGGGGSTTSVVTGATWTKGGDVVKTTGKVFFTMGGVRYVCSGSAIADPDGTDDTNVVLTAGHCVWDDTDKFATDWVFYPGYDNGPGEAGAWTATSLFTTSGWHDTKDRDFANDAGIAVVTGEPGETLEGLLSPLPSMGSSTNPGVSPFSAFGYPAAKKYHGGTLTYCQGPVEVAYDGENTVSMVCDMTGGSSGGPWYQGQDGTGPITSLNSYGYGGLNRMFGPTFDSTQEGAMLGSADDGTCDLAKSEICTSIPAA